MALFETMCNTNFYNNFAHRHTNGELIVSSLSQLNLITNIVFYQFLYVPNALQCIFMPSIAPFD